MRYIEPCCVQNQIPQLMDNYGAHYFVTSGDVTFEHFIRNIGAPIKGMKTVVICKRELTVYDCRLLAWFMGHGDWWNGLILVTQDDQTEMIKTELAGHEKMFVYQCVPALNDEMVVLWNEDGESVIMMGSLTTPTTSPTPSQGGELADTKTSNRKRLCHYSLKRTHTMQLAYEALFGVWMHLHRVKTENQFIREFFNTNYYRTH